MANEILVSALLQASKGGRTVSKGTGSQQIDWTGTDYIQGTQTIGTTQEAIALGDIGTPGWCWFKNKDASNYVELRAGSTGADVVRLNAGEEMAFRWAADAVPYAIANTAAVEIEYVILEA